MHFPTLLYVCRPVGRWVWVAGGGVARVVGCDAKQPEESKYIKCIYPYRITYSHTVQTSYGYCMGKCIYPYMITYCSTAHSHVNARYILGSQSNVCAPADIRTPLTY